MKLRVLAFALAILAFFFFVGSPFQQAANAVAIVDDAIIMVLIAALSAVGITFWTDGAYENVKNYVSLKFNTYCTDNNVSVSGIQYARNNVSSILMNSSFVRLLNGFADYLRTELGLQNNSRVRLETGDYSVVDDSGVHYRVSTVSNPTGGTSLLYGELGSDSDATYYFNNGNLWVKVWFTYDGYFGITYQTPDMTVPRSRSTGLGRNYNKANFYFYYYPGDETHEEGIYLLLAYIGHQNGVSSYVDERFWLKMDEYLQDASVDCITGVITTPDEDTSYTNGDGAILDVGASWGDSLPDIIRKYLPSQFAGSNVASMDIEYVGEGVVQEEVAEAGSAEVSEDSEEYRIEGLQSVFPFCIPFDLYAFVSCLAADPVAPSFTWRFYVPGICDESIEIDLSEFDAAAQILRTMELLLFCVGLAFVTRKIIRG